MSWAWHTFLNSSLRHHSGLPQGPLSCHSGLTQPLLRHPHSFACRSSYTSLLIHVHKCHMAGWRPCWSWAWRTCSPVPTAQCPGPVLLTCSTLPEGLVTPTTADDSLCTYCLELELWCLYPAGSRGKEPGQYKPQVSLSCHSAYLAASGGRSQRGAGEGWGNIPSEFSVFIIRFN